MNRDNILNSIQNLPAFPVTVQKVSEVLNKQEYSIKEVVDVIELDQSVTANILKVCNSPYYSPRQKIATVHEAVVYLGRQNLIQVVELASTSRFFGKVKGYYLESVKLWEHSVGVAFMSRILAKKILGKDDARFFTAGLLHDIGKVVLGEYVHESFNKIMELVSTQKYSFLEAEEEIIGINHAELGGEIAARWRFPQDMHDAISYHHRPDLFAGDDDTIPWLLYLADQACLMMGIGGGTDGLAYRGLEEVISKFDISHKDLEQYMVILIKELKRAKELVNLI